MTRQIQAGDIVRIKPGSRPFSEDESVIQTRMGNGKVLAVGYGTRINPIALDVYRNALLGVGTSGAAGTRLEEVKILFENGYRDTFPVGSLEIMSVVTAGQTMAAPKVMKVKKNGKISMESVIISAEKKEQIMASISQIKHSDLIFNQWGFENVFEKGTAVSVLFYGVPGTGKTLASQAIADYLDAELKIYGTADIESSEPGGAERTIRKIFEEAKSFFTKEKRPRVILFDECDSLLFDRNKVGVILGAQINALLTEIEKHDGIIIFTTNRLGKLDPALERRITAKIEFEFPNRDQRFAIWKRMIPDQAPIDKKVSFKKLAEHPLSGGNIKNVVLNAARMAAYKGQKIITTSNFLEAIEKEIIGMNAFIDGKERAQQMGDYLMNDDHTVVVGNESVTKDVDKNSGIDKLRGFMGGKR